MEVREQQVVGKTVIGSDGNKVAIVRQLAFNMDGGAVFIAEDPKGKETSIPASQVQGVGDFIVLRPDAVTPPQTRRRPSAARAPKAPETPAATAPPVAVPRARAPVPSSPSCASCGRPLRAGAKFCGSCGTRVG